MERPQLKAAGKPFSSLAILITAVSEKNDQKIIDTLMAETINSDCRQTALSTSMLKAVCLQSERILRKYLILPKNPFIVG